MIFGQEEPIEILLSVPETADVGGTFDLVLTVNPGGKEIGGWTCEVVFSADVCQASSVTPDPMWSEFFDTAQIDNGQGRITAIQTWKKDAYPTTSHTLCSITLHAINSGTCTFFLENVTVTDASFSHLNVTVREITITVSGETPSNPTDEEDPNADSDETTDDVTDDGNDNETAPESPVDNETDQQETDEGSENSDEGNGGGDPLEPGKDNSDELYGAQTSNDGLQDTVLPLVIIAIVGIAAIFIVLLRTKG